MPEVSVTLAIDRDQYLKHYRDGVRDVVATSNDGKTLRFPANILRGVVTHDGVRGTFVISYSAQGRFTGIRRV